MKLVLPKDLLVRYHWYCVQFLPNEVGSLLVGHEEGDKTVVTGFVHLYIKHSTPDSVSYAWEEDFFTRARGFYTVGKVHTHPSDDSCYDPSDADIRTARSLTKEFRELYGRELGFVIYVPAHKIAGIHDTDGYVVSEVSL